VVRSGTGLILLLRIQAPEVSVYSNIDENNLVMSTSYLFAYNKLSIPKKYWFCCNKYDDF
jgi:hypothetical protein